MKALFIVFLLCVPAFAAERAPRWLSFTDVDALYTKLSNQRFPATEKEMMALIPRENVFVDLRGVLSNSTEERRFWITLTDSEKPEGFFVLKFTMQGRGDIDVKLMRCESAMLEFRRYLPHTPGQMSLDREFYALEHKFPKKA
jgi:hypothetical protein